MAKIPSIFEKNISMFLHSRISSLVFILGPIFLMLLLGATLKDTSFRNIEAGIYSQKEIEFVNTFEQKLKERNFIVEKITDLEYCKNKVVNSELEVCLEFIEVKDENFKTHNYPFYDIELYVDFSKQRTVWGIISSVQIAVEEVSNQIREEMIIELKKSLDEIKNSLSLGESKIESTIKIIELTQEGIILKRDQTKEEVIDLKETISKSIVAVKNNLESIAKTTSVPSSLKSIDESIVLLDKMSEEVNSLDVSDPGSTYLNRLEETKKQLKELENNINSVRENIEVIKSIDANRISDPIALRYSTPKSQGAEKEALTFLDFLFPSILMLFLVFTSLIFSTLLTIRERESKAYIRNIASNTKGITFITGNFLTSFFLLLFQVFIIIITASYFLNLFIISNLLPLFILVSVAITFSILLGFVIGNIFNSNETAIIASILTSIVLFIFSPSISPTEAFPNVLKTIINLFPTVIIETAIRKTVVFDIGVSLSKGSILSIIFSLIVFSSLIALLYAIKKRKEI